MADFVERLFDGPLPWAKVRQGLKLIRLGQRYTPERLDAACRKALTVDLIDVRRVERILVEALEQSEVQGASPAIACGSLHPARLSLCPQPPVITRRSAMTRVTELMPLLKRLQLGPMAATPARAHRLGQKGPVGLCLIPGDHPR